MLENSLLFILGFFLIAGALVTIAAKEVAYNIAGFLISMIALAGLFGLLDNSFLFLAQIMISVGAVAVLATIVIMTLNLRFENQAYEPNRVRIIIGVLLLEIPIGLVIYKALAASGLVITPAAEGYGTLKSLGKTLFEEWLVPFELVSILLLAAMIAAIAIARREKYYDKEEYFDHYKPHAIETNRTEPDSEELQ